MDIEEYIKKIIDSGNLEEMEKLSDMLEDTLELIKEYDEKCYEEYEIELYKMAYGDRLNKKMAENIVSKMRPDGMRWSYEEVKHIQEQRGLTDIATEDFFVVINSAYNDYKNIFGEDIEGYVRFTLDFIEDPDAKEGKVFKYFTEIPL